ncbi:hypothetical protein GYB29_01270 [bacterium]|nr:hypothetical protein [bacterium]
MRILKFVLSLFFMSCFSSSVILLKAQVKSDSTIISLNEVSVDLQKFYPRISFLSQSPITFFQEAYDENIEGVAHRIIITTSEIYDTIYIDRVTFGPETCCKSIQQTWKIDSFEMSEKLELRGEFTGFNFIQWRNTNEFEFKLKGRNFIGKIVNSLELQIISN